MSALASTALPLPLGFEMWVPPLQGATLALLTFVQEDIPAVTAALLAAAGKLGWGTAYLACFLGIWAGDALLYLIARIAGRPILEARPFRGLIPKATLERSERWFREKGAWVLLSSRCLPGTRLPTYLAAGFLRTPFHHFLLITGLGVALWTAAIFGLARWAGPQLLDYLARWASDSVAITGGIVLSYLAFRGTVRLLDPMTRRKLGTALLKWRHWEFWPAWLFYLPVGVNYLWLAVRHRGWTLPSAANPGIFSGGLVGESKIQTLRELQAASPEFTAEASLVEGQSTEEQLQFLHELIATGRITLPFILKPDVGQRGAGVQVMESLAKAWEYLGNARHPVIAQRHAAGPGEAGVFYYRFPHEAHGRIFAITHKVFPVVRGNGRDTLEQLIWSDRRARFMAKKYLARLGARAGQIVPAGESIQLVQAGNHAQGCVFEDGAHLWSHDLEKRIDQISQGVTGFFIGRYDIRYASAEDFRAGRNFQIIELNGAAAEATSIYDARNSLVKAYRQLFQQWQLVFAIGAANRERGTAAISLKELWRAWRQASKQIATYSLAD